MLVSIEYCNVVNNNQPLDIQQKKNTFAICLYKCGNLILVTCKYAKLYTFELDVFSVSKKKKNWMYFTLYFVF